MQIHWYPGHMTKSMRLIEANLKLVDLVLYVLDARAPLSCINPQFDALIGKRPVIYVLNKADLGDKDTIEGFKKILSSDRTAALTTNATASGSAQAIVALAKKMCAAKLEKFRLRGVKTSVKAMVIGVPNCGKSTIVNNLCGYAKTVTGNRAGVTRGKQWVRVNDYFEVLDTPGTLYPKLYDQRAARRLAFIGSIRDEVLDTVELGQELIAELETAYPRALTARYPGLRSGAAALEDVGRARGFIVKGGEVDVLRAATAVIDDFRKGRLGGITLDKAEEYDERSV